MTTASIFIDSDGDGWSDEEEELYGTNSSDPDSFPSDNDGDYIPDDYDDNDDNDGLTDDEELGLGSNPKDPSDVIRVISEYGVFFFVDTDGNGEFDIYYNKTSKINTTLVPTGNDKYLVDTNGDGEWDYIYNYTEGNLELYSNSESTRDGLNWILVILLVVIVIISSLFIYIERFKGGKK